MEIFDETGKLRQRQTAEENIEVCLELLETEMGYEKQVKNKEIYGRCIELF